MRAPASTASEKAFTRSDALALLATAGLLAGLLLTTAAGTRSAHEAMVCRSNLKLLGQAWQAYALDHSDRVIGSPDPSLAGAGSQSYEQQIWATGRLTWGVEPDNTNRAHLQIPAFVPYVVQEARVFHCPADRFVTAQQSQRGWVARARSYSMNFQFGPTSSELTPLRRFLRLPDVPDPSRIFVFLEEHPDSVGDPIFITAFGGSAWVDMPASHHERAAQFLFADTHVEQHSWRSSRTVLPVRFNLFNPPAVSASDPDFRWVQERTSIPRP